MAVPRNRVSNSKKNMRRSHHAKKPTSAGTCSNCGKSALSHRVCQSCGYYGKKEIVAKKVEE